MKAVLNGGIIIGTLDGANIEIRDEVGEENMFIFGHTAEEIAARPPSVPTPELQRVIDTIAGLNGGEFAPIVNILTTNDRYYHCADFPSYVAAQTRAAETWLRRDDWTRMSIHNTARAGWFSADRTVAESDLLAGAYLLLRKGARDYALIRVG